MFSCAHRRYALLLVLAWLGAISPIAMGGVASGGQFCLQPQEIAPSDTTLLPTNSLSISIDEGTPNIATDPVPSTQPVVRTQIINDPLPPAFPSGLLMLVLAIVLMSMPRVRRRLMRL